MSVEDFWKKEEEKDKKFMKEFDKEINELYENHEPLLCSEKCINNIGGQCSIDNWSCRTKLDKKEMKFN